MSTSKLLTPRQIAGRKRAAIGLIGTGLIVPVLLTILVDQLFPYLFSDNPEFWIDFMDPFRFWIYPILDLMVVAGLLLISRLEDRRISSWTKHWIIAYLLLFAFGLLGEPIFALERSILEPISEFPPILPIVHLSVMTLLIFLIPNLYLFCAVDPVRRNSTDPQVRHGVRTIQSALALTLLVDVVVRYSLLTHLYNRIMENISLNASAGLFAFLFSVIPVFMLFFGVKQLIHSSLFASVPEDLETFRAPSQRKGKIFPLSVGGLLTAMAICLGLCVLLSMSWNDIYYEIF